MTEQLPTPEETPQEAKPKFLSTPLGKVVVIGGALGALCVILGIVAVIFLFGAAGDALDKATEQAAAVPKAQKVVAKKTSSEEDTPSVPVTNADVFVARDPFAPLIEPTKTVDATSSAKPSDETTPNVGENELVLRQVIHENGTYKAVLYFDGTTYTAGANETLGSTPWKVLSVSSDSAVMLYGDVKVTLTVGEGMVK